MTAKRKVKIGVIGAGRIGRLHAAHLATRIRETELVGIADVNLAAAQETAAQWEVPRAVEDYRVLLDDPALDAVAICSSSDTHTQIIRDVAAAGKHIFCEKPIGHDLSQIDSALAAVEKAGVKLQVGFNRRFDLNFLKVRELIAGGRVGTPHILRITSRDPEPPPVEYVRVWGGLFLETTIHDFDLARWLMASEVKEIYATGAVMADPRFAESGNIDTAVITLRFANGAMGTIDNSLQAVYGYDQRIEVFGSGGMVTAANRTSDTHVYSDAEGVHSSRPLYFFLERYTESYLAEMAEYVACVLNDTPPPVTGLDGRIAVVMVRAAQRSYEEHRPVQLSEIEA